MPITMAGRGEANVIVAITGNDQARRRLAELGFVVGERVTVVSQLGGNVILAVKDGRVALGRDMAMRIMV